MGKVYFIADEQHDSVDAFMSKTIICIVEYMDANLPNIIDEFYNKQVIGNPTRFPNASGKKFHASGLSQDQRVFVLNFISKLPFVAKVYIFYDFGTTPVAAKVNAMQAAVRHIKAINKNNDIDIRIERATEYGPAALKPLLQNWEPKYILPDMVLFVFSTALANTNREGDSFTRYKLLREKIRLHSYFGNEFSIRKHRGARM